LQALERLLVNLPGNLPAAIPVVHHASAVSHLTGIDRTTTLSVVKATSGQKITLGRVYGAFPGVHLLLHDRPIPGRM